MGGYPPVLRPGGCLEQQIDMHRAIANTLSELRIEWTSWISLWSFPAHLNDLDFYKGPDEHMRYMHCAMGSCREGVHGMAD
jgi:hypothetical protein